MEILNSCLGFNSGYNTEQAASRFQALAKEKQGQTTRLLLLGAEQTISGKTPTHKPQGERPVIKLSQLMQHLVGVGQVVYFENILSQIACL